MTSGDSLGNYKIIRLLGRGGMGEVYLALDTRLGRHVALKMISEKTLSDGRVLGRFKREAHAAAMLNHPNICAIYDVGEWQNRPYIAMEYVEGRTLHDFIRTNSLSVSHVIDISIQLAEALEEAHNKNVIHRDIKSSNIMVTNRNLVKLLDFGLAKLSDPGPEARQILESSHHGIIVGTVEYMSPEQVLGEKVDHRTDIFSLGVVLYEMLTGEVPFAGNGPAQTIAALLNKDLEPVTSFRSDIPDAFSRIVERMLSKDKNKRYQHAREVLADLQQLRSSNTQPITVTRKAPNMRPVLIVAALLIVVFTVLKFYDRLEGFPGFGAKSGYNQITTILPMPCQVYGSTNLQYLTDAIPNSLSTLLARVPGIQTRFPPGGFEVEKVKGDLDKIAGAYGVSTLILSTVSVEQNRLVLNVQLVQTPNRKVLWSNQYVGTIQNYIELTRQAADGIRGVLRPDSSPIVIASVSGFAANSGAELAFREGKFYAIRYGALHKPSDFDDAESAFKRSLQLDSKLADAAGEIAILYYLRFQLTHQKSDLDEVNNWGRKTLDMDPQASNGWTAVALVELGKKPVNTQKLLTYALKAASFGRNSSQNQVTLSISIALSSLSLSLKAADECLRLDPLFYNAYILRMGPLVALGRSEEGLSTAHQFLQVEPNNPIVQFYQSLMYSYVGRLADAKAVIKQLQPIVNEGRFYKDLFLIAEQAHALQSRQYEESERLDHELDAMETPEEAITERAQYIAPLLVRHGKGDEALKLLKRAVDLHELPHDLLMNPDFKPLHDDPRFKEIYSRSKLNQNDLIRILQENKSNGDLPDYLDDAMKQLVRQNAT